MYYYLRLKSSLMEKYQIRIYISEGNDTAYKDLDTEEEALILCSKLNNCLRGNYYGE